MFAARNAFMAGQAKKTALFSGINSSASNTVTIPTHAAGDLIIIFVTSQTATVTMPGGWTLLDAIDAEAFIFPAKLAYRVASSNSTTSGTWTNANRALAAVFTNVSSVSPIGGHAIYQDSISRSYAPMPAVTMADSSGSSQIFSMARVSGWGGTFPNTSAPSGYTKRLGANDQFAMTKDTTTSDGYIQVTASGSGSFLTAQVEIRSA